MIHEEHKMTKNILKKVISLTGNASEAIALIWASVSVVIHATFMIMGDTCTRRLCFL